MKISPILNTLRHILTHPLNRESRLESMIRYFRWQIGSRLVHAPIVVPFVNDAHLLVETGLCGATGNIYTGLHEFVEMAFALHLLRPNDLFVDVGSNVGSYVVLASAGIGS